jgi:hypothetical protein
MKHDADAGAQGQAAVKPAAPSDQPDLPTDPAPPATLALRVRAHRVFPLVRLREKAAGAFWLIPALFFAGAILAAMVTQRIDQRLTPSSVSSPLVWSADNAVGGSQRELRDLGLLVEPGPDQDAAPPTTS